MDGHISQLIRAEAAQSGPAQPGNIQSGTAQPGTTGPETTQPGTAQPGTGQPGTAQPGTGQPESILAGSTKLSHALMESRARWRDFALLAADMAFELDAEGRFAFLAPEIVLGHAAEALLGRPAADLLACPASGGFPFAPGSTRATPGRSRHAKAWLRRADGDQACLDFTLMPQPEGALRGVARDITAAERRGELAARALRRANALGSLLRLAARQGSTEASLDAMLAALPTALSCAGAALLLAEDGGWRIAHMGNARPPLDLLPPPGVLAGLHGPPGLFAMAAAEAGPSLVAWRTPGQPPLDAEDRDLLAALALPMATLHSKVMRQRVLARAAENDSLTGLLNRRGFTNSLSRQLQSGAPGSGAPGSGGTGTGGTGTGGTGTGGTGTGGTGNGGTGSGERRAAGALVFIDLDGLKPLNDRLGHEAGDAALCGMADRLRAAAAPEDLVARLGGDEFCLWLHDTDEAGAVRRIGGIGDPGPLPGWPDAGPAALRASFGIAVPLPGEDVGDLLSRADAAMYAAKRIKVGERRR